MAYWIDPRTQVPAGGTRTLSFYADTEEDIAKLPTSTQEGTGGLDRTDNRPVEQGSDCICIGNSSLYVLNSEDVWVKM